MNKSLQQDISIFHIFAQEGCLKDYSLTELKAKIEKLKA